MVIFGSSKSVRQRLAEYQREIRFNTLVTQLHFGTLPHDVAKRSMELFAHEVMPELRPLRAGRAEKTAL